MQLTQVDPSFSTFWQTVLKRRSSDVAIFSEDGKTIRTFADIESERYSWREKLASFPSGSVLLVQFGNEPVWPALLLACLDLKLIMAPLEPEPVVAQSTPDVGATLVAWPSSQSALFGL